MATTMAIDHDINYSPVDQELVTFFTNKLSQCFSAFMQTNYIDLLSNYQAIYTAYHQLVCCTHFCIKLNCFNLFCIYLNRKKIMIKVLNKMNYKKIKSKNCKQKLKMLYLSIKKKYLNVNK